MKKLLYTLICILLHHSILAQTTTENYVKSTIYQVETTNGINKTNTVIPIIHDDKIETVTYFDGLGRPMQSIQKQIGGSKQDIITPVVYDNLGRQTKNYLPYADSDQISGSNLNYRATSTLLDDLEDYYVNKYPEDQITTTTINAYSETHFERSPLNRVIEQGAPGKDWQVNLVNDTDHTIKFDYQTNVTGEVDLYKVVFPTLNTEAPELFYDGEYVEHELYKTITKDENWTSGKNHTVEEFKNKQGQIILKRTYSDSDLNNNGTLESNEQELIHDTYYVYDDFGNLTFVLSPEGSDNILDANDNIAQTVLDDLCYQYRYDSRNRLIEKKIPQKGWEYIVYDKLDRPILTQDALMRPSEKWLFTKYDAYDRVVYTGKFGKEGDTYTRTGLQGSANSSGTINETRETIRTIDNTDIYYSSNAFPGSSLELYTINYYDDYEWDTGHTFEASYEFDNVSSGLEKIGNQVKKIANTNNWDEGFKTEGSIEGDGYIQWTVAQNDKKHMIGLSEISSAPNNNYNTIDYGIFLKEDGYMRIFEEGVVQGLPGNLTYSPQDVFKVERKTGQIIYYKNNIAFHASITSSTGVLIGDSSFYSENTIVEDVFIGYSSLGQPFTSDAKGLFTGGKVRVLDTNEWTTTSSYYDDKARTIYSISENDYLSSIEAVSSYLDFTGNVIKAHKTHDNDYKNKVIVTIDDFIYDHADRPIRHEQKINNHYKELISKNNYDELGQLAQKQVGGRLPSISTYTFKEGVSTSSSTITKTAATGWGNSGLSTQESISKDGYISFSTTQSAKAFMCGLSYSDTNSNWDSVNYGILIQWNGQVGVRETGADRGIKTTHVPGDVFLVERRGTTIYYLKNGSPFYISQVQTSTAPMIGDLSIHDYDATVKNLVLVDLEQELQKVDYTYNIRGWLKGINDVDNLSQNGDNDLFGFKLNYNTRDNINTTTLYNGNISEVFWNTRSYDPSTDEFQIKRGYTYGYDPLNRILEANFEKSSGANQNIVYDLSGISYDRNGNIKTLKRSGVDISNNYVLNMDDLAYSYDGNQLTNVIETGNNSVGFKQYTVQNDDYEYDANGNMTKDKNKDITSITYNHLNLPVEVKFGITSTKKINYIYDATGVKIKKVVTDNSNINSTEYMGNYIFENDNLKLFSHPEGYIEPDGKFFDYIYQYKDHLGNIRLSYSDSSGDGSINPNLEIIEENNYYPFGLKHKGYNNVVVGTQNNFKTFNGKEFDMSLGMNTFDLGARHMDPAIGRFMVIDPMTDFFHNQSPYSVANNNPVGYVDYYGFGIWNWLKAVVRKAGNAIGSLFSGSNCSCKGKGESLSQAFRRPDNILPKRKKRRPKPNEPATESGLVRRPKVKPLNTNSQGLAILGDSKINSPELPSIDIPEPAAKIVRSIKPRVKVVDEIEEDVGAPIIDVNLSIPFLKNSTTLEDEAGATKILSDLIKTLKEYPQMKVIVEGTFGAKGHNPQPNLNTEVPVNGGIGPVEWLTGGRANAIIKILTNNGVDPKQLIKGHGIIGETTNVNVKSKSD